RSTPCWLTLRLPSGQMKNPKNGCGDLSKMPPTSCAHHWSLSVVSPSSIAMVPCPMNKTDRKSTRLYFSHVSISYAVFCLKKTNALAEVWYEIREQVDAESEADETAGDDFETNLFLGRLKPVTAIGIDATIL